LFSARWCIVYKRRRVFDERGEKASNDDNDDDDDDDVDEVHMNADAVELKQR